LPVSQSASFQQLAQIFHPTLVKYLNLSRVPWAAFCIHSMTASGCLCALHSITAASGYSYSNVFHPVSPRPNFPWPLMMFSSASLATCPEDEKCLGQMEKGERRIKR